VNALTALVEGGIFALVFALSRVSGLIAVAPLPWSVAPLRVRVAVAMLLSFVAATGPARLEPGFDARPLVLALGVFSELAIGACMGMTIRLVVASAEIAADFVAPQLGLGVAQLFDPHAQISETPLGTFWRYFAMLLVVVAGFHRQVLGVWFESFGILRPGTFVSPSSAAEVMLAVTVQSIEAGVRIAIPVVAVLFMVQIALAFIARAAPALQIFAVGFAVTLGVGFLVILLCLPDTAQLLLAEISRVDSRIETLLAALLEAPP
jgi:flagellar biosynthetic protein FliR